VELSGWVGRIDLGPEVATVAELLAVGEVLQVGRHTSEGLGRYRLRWR
jgi:CRISPR/Cas system endoribonuclease Cas6 (RAMP superfamily)